MIIFEDNNREFLNNIFSKKITILKKRFTFFLISFSILGTFIFIPLNLGIKDKDSTYFLLKGITKIVRDINLQTGFLVAEIYENDISIFDITKNYLKSLFQKDKTVNLNIKFLDYRRLRDLRNEALENKILLRSNNDEIKASISYEGEVIPVKLRLKGDVYDHLIGNKWSYRIKTRKNKTIFGMREFSLQQPRTRNFINEYIYHSLLKNEGLPYLRYKFLTLKLNGKNLGTYSVEESFDKLLIENSGFREGPIIKFNENTSWKETSREISNNNIINETYTSTYWTNNAELDTFNKKRNFDNNKKKSQAFLAKKLLNEFLLRKKKTSEVFDIKRTAIYFAIHDLFNLQHPYSWHNIRFYFDPIAAKLIPIGYDAQYRNVSVANTMSIDRNPFGIFDDKEFIKEYIKQLERISNKNYIELFFKENDKNLQSELNRIHRSYPHVKIHYDQIYGNLEYIKNRINQIEPIYIKENNHLKDNKLILSFYNKAIFPIEILSLWDNENDYLIDEKILLNGTNKFKRNIPQKYNFNVIENKKDIISYPDKIWIKYKVYGSKHVIESHIDLKPWYPSKSIDDAILNRKSNYKQFKFLDIYDSKKLVLIKRGSWEINKPLILPKGYKFIIKNGTQIKTNHDGIILLRGPLEIKGKKDSPVLIHSEDSGKGIIVSNSLRKSSLNHVIFSGLNSPNSISLSIMGAVNFYNSPISISNTVFKNINAEDALNIVSSEFKITNSSFENISSDAFDSDFSNGMILNSKFNNIRNDAIDISGSLVKVISSKIENVGDKALSIGERSNLEANFIEIKNSNIGIASKDFSTAKFNNLEIKNTTTCFASFQKKPEYGPGSIELKSNYDDLCESYILEEGSTISSPLKSFIPNTKNAYNLLYGKNKN